MVAAVTDHAKGGKHVWVAQREHQLALLDEEFGRRSACVDYLRRNCRTCILRAVHCPIDAGTYALPEFDTVPGNGRRELPLIVRREAQSSVRRLQGEGHARFYRCSFSLMHRHSGGQPAAKGCEPANERCEACSSALGKQFVCSEAECE